MKPNEVEQPERPMFRLQRICYNCTYQRRKKEGLWSYSALCRLIETTNPDIKKLPLKERRNYWTITPIDATCDFHLFRGRAKEKAAEHGAYPLE